MKKLLITILILTLFISISFSEISVKKVLKLESNINGNKLGEAVKFYEKIVTTKSFSINVKKENKVQYKVWQKTFGGENDDYGYSVKQTKDEGYIIAGHTWSFGNGGSDLYVMKLDKNGYTIWEKAYGGKSWDKGNSIYETTDNGFIAVGGTKSVGSGNVDFYIIKLDKNGNKIWEKAYGGSKNEEAYSVQQTKDGGYIVAGLTYSIGSGGKDVYIIKLDRNGNKVWDKTYGGNGWDEAFSIQQTIDGGYIVAGFSDSFGAGNGDFYIIKLNKNGSKEWEKTFGGKNYDEAYSIQQTKDKGYIVVGWTESFSKGGSDVYIIKLNENGDKVWEKTFGGKNNDWGLSIQQTNDSGYIVAGVTESFGFGGKDVYIIKLNKNGNKAWEKTYGGIDRDEALSIWQTCDGGYIIAGFTLSFGSGGYDVYVIKINEEGNTGPYPQ